MIKLRYFPIVFVFFLTPSYGQTGLSGFMEYDNITYFKQFDNKINGRNQGILQLDINHTVNSKANAFSSIKFRADQADPSRNRINFDEGYINLYLGNFDFRIGKQIYAWGKTDRVNPTNYFASYDYTDILDTEDEEIGLLSVDAKFYLGSFIFEGVVVPSFTPSTLAERESRWWPDLPETAENPNYPSIGSPLYSLLYSFPEPDMPKSGLENTQYGFKISGFNGGFDYSLSGYHGYDDLPDFYDSKKININQPDTIYVIIEQSYKPVSAVGFDLAKTLGKYSLRTEAAYFITSDWKGTNPKIDDPFFQYAIGVDRRFLNDDIIVLLQWVQEIRIPDRNYQTEMTDLKHFFSKTLLGNIEYNIGNYFKAGIQGFANIENKDWWIRPAIEWTITDGLDLTLSSDFLSGPEGSYFGMLENNNRLQFRLKYNFELK